MNIKDLTPKNLKEASPFTWRKGPNGNLRRTITPKDIAAKQAAQKRKAMAKGAPAREEPIGFIDYELIEQLAEKSVWGLGGEIVDIVSRKPFFKRVNNVDVAAVRLGLYIAYDLRDMGYDDETIKGMAEYGDKGVSDVINVTIYRDPQFPKRLRLSY